MLNRFNPLQERKIDLIHPCKECKIDLIHHCKGCKIESTNVKDARLI